MPGSFSKATELPATGIYVLTQKTSRGGVNEWLTVPDMLLSIHRWFSLHPFSCLLHFLWE